MKRTPEEAANRRTARFWAQVDKSGDCWLWTGRRSDHGYGRVSRDGKPTGAHRVAYELVIGPIPEGLYLDHLCRVRHCVNPAHLEPVTNAENLRRVPVEIRLRTSAMARKTHCPQGHPYDAANTMHYDKRSNSRGCRTCHNTRQALRARVRRARIRLAS